MNESKGLVLWWSLSGNIGHAEICGRLDDAGVTMHPAPSSFKSCLRHRMEQLRTFKTQRDMIVRNVGGMTSVYLQKPFSTKSRDAELICEASAENGVVIVANQCEDSDRLIVEVESLYAAAVADEAFGTVYNTEINTWLKKIVGVSGMRLPGGKHVWIVPQKSIKEWASIEHILTSLGQDVASINIDRRDVGKMANTVSNAIAAQYDAIFAEINALDSLSARKKDGYVTRLAMLQSKINAFQATMDLRVEVLSDAYKKVTDALVSAVKA